MPLVARSKKLLLSLPLKRPMQNLKEKKAEENAELLSVKEAHGLTGVGCVLSVVSVPLGPNGNTCGEIKSFKLLSGGKCTALLCFLGGKWNSYGEIK
jgi:hypothetical protein